MRTFALAQLPLTRRVEALQAADGRQEVAIRIFCIHTALNSPAIDADIGLLDGQLLAGANAQHLLDKIDTGDHLGHRVLHLQAGVHFKEVEALVLARHDELHRTGAVIVHGLGKRDGLFAHLLAGFRIEQRRRRFLDDLLVPALDRAFALIQVDAVAVLVAQHLDFDVARLEDEFLDEDAVIAEGGFGFRLHGREAFFDVLVIIGDADALAAAAGRGLDHDRVADLLGDLHGFLRVLDQAHMARHRAHTRFGSEFLGADLVAHGVDGEGVRTDPADPFFFQTLRETGVLGQEAETRMDGLGARGLHGLDDLVGNQVGFGGRRRTDMHGLIRHLDGHRAGIGIGIHNHRLHTHTAAGLDDADGDLAPVCNQDLLEHLYPGRPVETYSLPQLRRTPELVHT